MGLILSCSQSQNQSKKQGTDQKIAPNVVYGSDDRLDFYEIQDPSWQQLALATSLLVDRRKLETSSQFDSYQLKTITYGHNFHLCEDEPFYSQPTSGFCSGFLVAPDLLITAGHCLRNETNCKNVRFVFDYSYQEPMADLTLVKKKNVYHCKELIHSQANALTGVDLAIARLDRPVTDRAPLSIRKEGEIKSEELLTAIGYPKGLPLKFAPGGIIRDNSSPNFMVTSLDTYGGNSGSAVFNSVTQKVEGILVRGESDFKFDQEDRCRRTNVCAWNECRGEDVVRIQRIMDYLSEEDLEN